MRNFDKSTRFNFYKKSRRYNKSYELTEKSSTHDTLSSDVTGSGTVIKHANSGSCQRFIFDT